MRHVAETPTAARGGRVRGLALVTVISVMLILIVITTGFTAFTTQDMKTAQTSYEQAQTYALAEAGIDYGFFLLKHNMLVYPSAPNAWPNNGLWTDYMGADNPAANSGPCYDADNADADRDERTGRDRRGSLINVTETFGGHEYVLVSDLSYPTFAEQGSPTNWWDQRSGVSVRYVGTFNVKCRVSTVSLSSTAATVRFTSTGYIKGAPAAANLQTVAGFSTQMTEANGWQIVAQRTLIAEADLVTLPAPGARSLRLTKFYERFR